MNRFKQFLLTLGKDECGQDLVEYAFILAFLGLVGLATMKNFAASIAIALTAMGNKITSAV